MLHTTKETVKVRFDIASFLKWVSNASNLSMHSVILMGLVGILNIFCDVSNITLIGKFLECCQLYLDKLDFTHCHYISTYVCTYCVHLRLA